MTMIRPLESACRKYEEDLVLYYYEEIADKERASVDRHLASCGACKRFLDDLRRLLPQMTRTEALPASFWDNYYRQTLAKLARHEEKQQRWRSWLSPVHSWMMPAFGTVAVAVLVVGLMFGKDNLRLFVDPGVEKLPQEILADKNQLEFFKSMDMLEALGKLEAQEETKSDGPRTEIQRVAAPRQVA